MAQSEYGSNQQSVHYMDNALRTLLGSEYTLYVKTQNYHWNVVGLTFGPLHALFREEYEALAGFVDLLAEQIRKYGSAAPGSMTEFLALKVDGITESRGALVVAPAMIYDLLTNHQIMAQFIGQLNKDQLDLATQNLLGDLLDFHLKASWMLKAQLE